MTSKERVMAALNLKQPDKIPYIDWFLPNIKKQIIEFKKGENKNNDADFAKLIGLDGIGFDEYMPPFFCKMLKDENGIEHVQGEGLILSEKDLSKMIFPDPKNEAFYDPAKRFIDQYGREDLALFAGFRTGMLGSIFAMGIMGFSMALHDNLKFVEAVISRYTEWTSTVLEKVQQLGFDFLISYDDIAFNSGPLFSPQVLREVFIPNIRPIIDTIKLPWVYHSDGDLTKVMDDLISMGPKGIMSFQPDVMNMKEMKDKYGDKICVWGNIDLHYTLTRGTVDEVVSEVKQRIIECGPGGGFIISSSNSITDYCKLDNVLAMIDAIDQYRNYPISTK